MSGNNNDVLVSGKRTFRLQVPYRLIETGEKGIDKPLIVYLHGFAQSSKWMEDTFLPEFQTENAFHLFIQAPFVLFEHYIKKQKEAYAWYLFGGDKERYIESMEHSAEFIQEIIDHMLGMVKAERVWMIGFSMGGYLTGYYACTRSYRLEKALTLNGRYKSEWVKDWTELKKTTLFAVHGKDDVEVPIDMMRQTAFEFAQHGVNIKVTEIDGTHEIDKNILFEAKKVLFSDHN